MNTKYRKPEVKKVLVDKRCDGLSWKEIVIEINKKFKFKMTEVTAKKIYEEAIAEGLLQSKKMRNTFSKYADKMNERYEKACQMVDWLSESVEKIKFQFDSEDGEDLQRYLKFIKLAPTIIATSREILNQLEFIRKEQERINITQTNMIYSPIQINQLLHKSLEGYVNEGKIKILKEIPEIRKLSLARVREKNKKEDKEDGSESDK